MSDLLLLLAMMFAWGGPMVPVVDPGPVPAADLTLSYTASAPWSYMSPPAAINPASGSVTLHYNATQTSWSSDRLPDGSWFLVRVGPGAGLVVSHCSMTAPQFHPGDVTSYTASPFNVTFTNPWPAPAPIPYLQSVTITGP